MKEKGYNHVEYHVEYEEDQVIDKEFWPQASSERNLEGKGILKWYNFLPWKKFIHLLPKLRYLRGSKAKISLTTFDEINKVCQQIFEGNKTFFRYRVQVDLLAHYIGTKILEQIYIIQKDQRKDPLSQILEDQEEQFKIWDRMKTIKEIFQDLSEKYTEGFITQKQLDFHIKKYISTFEDSEDRVKMADIIEKMIQNGEVHRAEGRIRARKNYSNQQKIKESKLQTVK